MNASTLSTVRLLTATVKPRLSMLSTRFSPMTASPMSPMSALSCISLILNWLKVEPPGTEGNSLALDSRRAALGECPHLLERGHRRVAGERREQRAVRPAELDGF